MTEAALGGNLIVTSIRAAAITKVIALGATAEEVNRWTRHSNAANTGTFQIKKEYEVKLRSRVSKDKTAIAFLDSKNDSANGTRSFRTNTSLSIHITGLNY
ncbi:MAG: hypothetical protein EZS28_035396 [Streblomastix strix]|uniref:Uncharacterized protein n=1 Tax=Streblomastix strix TaxID=222440 RepID=A0A5J4UHN8_9EUKA|nr:MAG: hypothetical protein EZS28_035396 [Streblomastix strix]